MENVRIEDGSSGRRGTACHPNEGGNSEGRVSELDSSLGAEEPEGAEERADGAPQPPVTPVSSLGPAALPGEGADETSAKKIS